MILLAELWSPIDASSEDIGHIRNCIFWHLPRVAWQCRIRTLVSSRPYAASAAPRPDVDGSSSTTAGCKAELLAFGLSACSAGPTAQRQILLGLSCSDQNNISSSKLWHSGLRCMTESILMALAGLAGQVPQDSRHALHFNTQAKPSSRLTNGVMMKKLFVGWVVN